MALGSIFNRFWTQVGRQVEAKVEPKSTKMALQKDVQKMITNLLCGPTKSLAMLGVGGPLKENTGPGAGAVGKGYDPSRSRAEARWRILVKWPKTTETTKNET